MYLLILLWRHVQLPVLQMQRIILQRSRLRLSCGVCPFYSLPKPFLSVLTKRCRVVKLYGTLPFHPLQTAFSWLTWCFRLIILKIKQTETKSNPSIQVFKAADLEFYIPRLETNLTLTSHQGLGLHLVQQGIPVPYYGNSKMQLQVRSSSLGNSSTLPFAIHGAFS